MADDVIITEEAQALVLALGRGMPDGFPWEDAERVRTWTSEARIDAANVDLVVRGELNLAVRDGEIILQSRDAAEVS